MKDSIVRYTIVDSPVGPLLVAGGDTGLAAIRFLGGESRERGPDAGWREDGRGLDAALEQLGEYFAGKRREFTLALAPRGTAFQIEVWRALAAIPYGRTESYGALARRIGHPGAARAVGAANGRNPLPIVLPCHRVIGADGSLTGFGGGLGIKRALLDLETGVAPLAGTSRFR